jgi:membrane protease subunit HflK
MADWEHIPPPTRRDDPRADIQRIIDQLRDRFAHRGPARFNPWLIVAVILLLYALSGIFIVAPDERGIVLRFGRVVREVDPGPGYHLPWPFEQVIKPG